MHDINVWVCKHFFIRRIGHRDIQFLGFFASQFRSEFSDTVHFHSLAADALNVCRADKSEPDHTNFQFFRF